MTIQSIEKQTNALPFSPKDKRAITAEELLTLGDIGRTELVRGRIIHLMPTGHPHGYIEVLISALLYNFVKLHKLGRVLGGEIGIFTRRDPDSVRAADAAFISTERYAQVQSTSFLDVCPELLVEILSPDDTWSHMHEKLAEYFSVDARLIWVIDPRLEQVHAYRSLDDVTRLTRQDQLGGGDVLPGFQVSIDELFEDAD